MTRVAVITGTGAHGLARGSGAVADVASTPWGKPSASIMRSDEQGIEVLYLARHGEQGDIPPHRVNYRANIAALAALSPDWVVAINAVGAIGAGLRPGTLLLPDQLIDYTWGRAHSYWDEGSENSEFIEFTNPYDHKLRKLLISAALQTKVSCRMAGCYGVTQGPRLETAAEILRMARDGCAVVGMTAMPEAGLAREAGLRYASVAVVVNQAAGLGTESLHAEMAAYMRTGMASARRLLDRFLLELGGGQH